MNRVVQVSGMKIGNSILEISNLFFDRKILPNSDKGCTERS